MPEKALRYYTAAGDNALLLYATAEAAGHYGEALQLALQQDTSSDELVHIFRNRGRALELNDEFDAAIDNYAEMESEAHERGDRALELGALAARASVHATQSPKHDPPQAKADSDRALGLARELNDRAAESRILWNLMMVNMHGLSSPQDAVAYGQESLAIARDLDLREQMAYSLSDLGWAHGGVAQLDRGAEMLDEARELWRELGNLPMLANNLSVSALFAFLRADYGVPVANSAEALEISRSIDNIWGQWSAASAPCFTYLELGEVGKSIEAAELADSLSREGGLALQQSFGDRTIAWVHASVGAVDLGRPYYLRTRDADLDGVPPPLKAWILALAGMFEIADGELDLAATHIDEALAALDLNEFTYPSPAFVLLARGQLALAQNDSERAVAGSDEMIEILRSAGARTFVPDALYFKGKGLLAQGKTAEARECLVQASSLAEEIGSKRILWQALGALSEVEAGLGNDAEAERSRERAREVVRFIAERTGSEDLRDSYLALLDVWSIVG